ncbi:MAG: ribose transport system permease protein [Nocardioides sp.]|jgi:ribose transport system permease protein|uniref:ABC transporter permease n=1 Tax=Nocardioides sp. TaxID=35761 RepID=UPI00262DF6B1|nr:ABC transporter permease [Nocardioides sp.]MCW2833526.1 ribose transport system permease protein [Nocardioides sp.]
MKFPVSIGKYGLVWGLIVLVVVFAALRPESFATTKNAGSILSDSAVLSLIALGIMVPLIVGHFDLSPGFVASLSVMLTAGLMSRNEMPWPVVLVTVILVGAGIGLFMGFLVGYMGLNSLIVSLGTGTVVSGLVLMYSGGEIIFQGIPPAVLNIGQTRLAGFIPLPFLYALGAAVIIWFVLAYRPVGRRLYAVGGSPEAARLVGIPVARYIMFSFMVSSSMAALAGFVQVARLGAGHPTSAQSFLLPAFAAAFLGATSFRPGLYNVWGTFVAVYLLAVGTTGLFMLGAQSYVDPIFNGAVLLTAVLVASLSARRKKRILEGRASESASTGGPHSDPPGVGASVTSEGQAVPAS